jgi:plastocyanin
MQYIQRLIAVAVTALITAPAAFSFDLIVELIDHDGVPVRDAVVEIAQRPASVPPMENAVIDQINRRFVPMVIAVTEGQWVNFPNSDNVRHHVYSFSEIRQFSTELYADEPIDPVQFDRAGIAVLGCNIHDSMVAYVYVSAWHDVTVSGDSGRLNFSELTENPGTLTVWHPWMDSADNTRIVDTGHLSTGDTIVIELPITRPDQNFGFRALSRDNR